MNQHQNEHARVRAAEENPLLCDWDTPFEAPPFERFAAEHFRPAIEAGMAEQWAEIDAIAADPAEPDFRNTIGALELSGRSLRRASSVFFNLTGAHTNDALQAIERELAPLMAQHRSAIYLNDALFRRVDAVAKRPDGLDDEQRRVLERYHTMFVRQGGGLPLEKKQRLAAITERLAVLGTNSARTCLPTRRALRSFWRAKLIWPGCRMPCARLQRRPPPNAAWRASMSSPCRAR